MNISEIEIILYIIILYNNYFKILLLVIISLMSYIFYCYFFLILFNCLNSNKNFLSSSQNTFTIYDNFTQLIGDDPIFKLISYSESVVEANMGIQLRQLTSLKIGTPFQEIKVKLSTAICGLWVVDKESFGHGFIPSESSSYKDLGMEGKVDFTRGEMSSDVFQYANLVTDKPVPFLLVNETTVPGKIDSKLDGLLGFGYKCRSKSIGNVNIIKSLIENKSQQYADMFTFTFDSVKEGGRFTVGTIPESLNINTLKYWEADVDEQNTNGHWIINFKSIFFDDDVLIPINSKISIGIGGCIFSVTKELFDYIIERYMQVYISKGECEIVKGEVFEIYCKEDLDISSFTKMSLIFGKWNWKLLPSKLFRNVTKDGVNKKWFTVVYYPIYNAFYLSQLMFEGRTSVVYDRANGVVGFYKEDEN